MAVVYDGALYNGPDNDAGRYYSVVPPNTPSGDFALFFIVKLDRIFMGADPTVTNSQYVGIGLNYLTGAGTGGSDCYVRLYPRNASGGNAGKLVANLKRSSNNMLGSGSNLTGSTQFANGDTLIVVLQSNGGTMELKTCKPGATAVSEASGARNAGYGAGTLGTWYFGHSASTGLSEGSPNYFQAFGMVNRALTDAEIKDLVDGVDPDSVVASGDRLHLTLFNSTGASIAATWGSAAATRVGTWTNQPVASPPVANASNRLVVTNEPPSYGAVCVNDDGTAPTFKITGTYTGTAPTAMQARIDNLDGTAAQDWTALGSFTASSGVFSGTVSVPLGGLYRLRVRDTNDTTREFKGGRPWSCCAVTASMGQSPHVYIERIYKNGSVAVAPSNAYVRPAGVDQIVPATAANCGQGLVRAINAYSTETSGKPWLIAMAAVTGTSSQEWADKASNVWPGLLATLDFLKLQRVLLQWLNGAADQSLSAATIKANHDQIIANLDADLTTTRSIAYRYKMLPHNRDASGTTYGTRSNQGKVRAAQQEWARDHAQAGSKVLIGPWWAAMQTDGEATGTAQAGAGSTITLAAADEATSTVERVGATIITTGGTGSGQTRTISSYNVGTKVATVSVAWTTAPDATTTYRLYIGSPHPSNIGGVDRIGARYGLGVANAFGYTAKTGRGPTIATATYPAGGNGSIIDVKHTHRQGSALRTPNGGTTATTIAGWEISTDGGTNWAAPNTATITDATTVRLTLASAPADKTQLRVRYGRLDPVATSNFDGVGAPGLADLLYDDASDTGPTNGAPVEFTTSDLTPTEAVSADLGAGFFACA